MNNLFKSIVVVPLAILVFLLVLDPRTLHAELDVIVPAYFYPVNNSPWDDLNVAASQVDITAIMNPASGSGGSQNSDYVSAVDALRSAGGKVVGYVPTTFGQKPIAQVQADIDNYYSWYNVDGIFFDEMSNSAGTAVIDYYQDLYAYVKSKDANGEVIGNPGTNTLEPYLNDPGGPTADQLVISENFGSQYLSYSPSSWVFDYERTNFAHLIHSEPSSTNMLDYLDLAVNRNAGSIYITNDVLNNPWDTLPSYWQAEIDAIEQINDALLGGDFNENGTVDGDDLELWNNGYGASSGASKFQGDANEDGDVDGLDFLQWQQDFGSITVPVPVATNSIYVDAVVTVPEPSSLSLLCALCLFACRSLNRRPLGIKGSSYD